MTPMELIGANFAIVIGGLPLVWLLSVALKDVSIVDLCWGNFRFPFCGLLAE